MLQRKTGISVAIASYNGAKYIEKQIASVLQQSYPPDEIIVCDDKSTDDTPAILKKMEVEGKLRYYANEQQLGIIGNFKKAVSLCNSSNYIALCDQDDVWLPNKLQLNYDELTKTDTNANVPAMVYSDVSLVNEDLSMKAPSFWEVLNIKPEKETLYSLVFGNFITGCTIMMSPSMSRLFCEMPSKNISMHDAWIGMIGYSFGQNAFIPKPLVLYRQHGQNATFETNRQSTLAIKLRQIKQQIVQNQSYLLKETTTVDHFLQCYSDRLQENDHKQLERFASLKSKTFAHKKLSSILARRYRYTS